MKALFLAFHVYRYLAVVSLSLGLEACATDTTTFLNYGGRVPPNVMTAPQVSDGLAINYANSIEIIMRSRPLKVELHARYRQLLRLVSRRLAELERRSIGARPR